MNYHFSARISVYDVLTKDEFCVESYAYFLLLEIGQTSREYSYFYGKLVQNSGFNGTIPQTTRKPKTYGQET